MKTAMRKLIARSRHAYGTRRLTAGDEYEATEMHARLLVGARRASYAPENVSQRSPEEAASVYIEDLAQLRIDAQRLGIEVDGRWGVVRLNHEIAQARAR